MNLREAAEAALKAMSSFESGTNGLYEGEFAEEIAVLRAALAEHDKKIVWVEERKAHWAEQLQLARETQERERQQREEAALAEPVQGCPSCEYNKARAQLWRHEAYKLGGHPLDWEPELMVRPKPLTDDEVVALFNRLCKERSSYPERRYRDFARWVEAAHGIGEKK